MRSKKVISYKDPFLLVCLISLVITYYIRSLGIALLAGYILYFLIRREWKTMSFFVLVFIAAALPWFIRSQKLGGGSYIKQLTMINPYQPALGQAAMGDYVERFFNNLSRYITREIPDSIFTIKSPEYHLPMNGGEWLLGIGMVALIIYGVYSLPRYRWLVGGYILGTLGILMIWPDVWIGVRFIVPMIPLLMLGFFYGLLMVFNRIKEMSGNKKTFQPYWLLIFILFMMSPIGDLHQQAKASYLPGWENYFAVAKWLKNNESGNKVVSCGKPSLFYLYSGNYTIRYKFGEPSEVLEHLEKNKVDYVVIDQVYGNTLRYLLPAIRQYPEHFEQVYHLRNPDTFLLKFKR